MAELVPAPFRNLVERLLREPQVQDSLFDLPRRKWYVPDASAPDMTVHFHDRLAGNPVGPASGPHTQMAQNLLLSYASGARILELKTVQVDDQLNISRPCIDMTNIGYNVEWSQELLVDQSLREYVAGAMLIAMFRHTHNMTGPDGEVLYDISLGYDLAGIRSEKVQRFLDGMRDADERIEKLRAEIPERYREARKLEYAACISNSVTLSTFHGCPADEIERICEFLIAERDLDVIVKMNPPMLGREKLEHLLHDDLGYTPLQVNPNIYQTGMSFEEGVQMCARLTRFARRRGRRFGLKFSNTLEVLNHRDFFTPDNKIMYLSGQPLYVITLTLTDLFRQAVGPQLPISFSAGIDSRNFPLAVACGFCPITTCTDLLRPGGYGRLPGYLQRLADEMQTCGASHISEYIPNRFGQREEAQRLTAVSGGSAEAWAGLLNTTMAADMARKDPRYHADHNGKVPKRMDSQLEIFDCITCDKCIPVCPNAANFTYPTPCVEFDYHDLVVNSSGCIIAGPQRHFQIDKSMQIACYADFCNECGNCDTFCPEYGGPYIKKPSFFGSLASWQRAAPRDGFVLGRTDSRSWIRGRIKGRVYKLTWDATNGHCIFDDGRLALTLSVADHTPASYEPSQSLSVPHHIDMGVYHTLRHLHEGILNPTRINQINIAHLE